MFLNSAATAHPRATPNTSKEGGILQTLPSLKPTVPTPSLGMNNVTNNITSQLDTKSDDDNVTNNAAATTNPSRTVSRPTDTYTSKLRSQDVSKNDNTERDVIPDRKHINKETPIILDS